VRLLAHFVWSTTGREPWIEERIEARLHAFIVGVCRREGCYVAAIGGTDDHIHLLCYLNHDITVAALMNRVKGASSRFATASLGVVGFDWQRGYAVFGVSPHDKDQVSAYVLDQRERHASRNLWPGAEKLAADTVSPPPVPPDHTPPVSPPP
jgi:putative transposase